MMMMDTDLMSSSSSARTGMDMLRSEAMMKVQLIIPVESAHNTITYLAQLGLLQFKDLNGDKSLVQRTYANQVKRCGEMARKLWFLHEEIQKAGLSCSQILSSQREIDLDKLETKLTEYEDELLEFSSNQEQLKRSHSELVEFELVLQKAGLFFPTIERDNVASEGGEVEEIGGISDNSPLLLEQEMQTIPFPQRKLGFITGLVLKAKVVAFERILFRATRGNMIFKYRNSDEHVTDLATGEKVEKIVFIVFFAGDWARLKVLKIAEAFGANLYPFPEQLGRQAQLLSEVSGSRSELQITIDAGTRHRNTLLTTIGLELKYWNMIVQREKAVYHTLNMLSIDVTRKCLVAEGWCPEFAKPQIQNVLHRAALNSNSQVRPVFQVFSTDESPPTYFKTNKFTQAFQEMIDAYGVARYQEINPGVFTIITFPFLFGIMFGDWGHGIVLLLASLYIVLREAKLEGQRLGDIMGMLFGGRYVILLMSIFSIYCGLIYNEFFSRSFPLFGSSSYSCLGANCRNSTSPVLAKVHSLPYRFGVDPAWHGTQTELPFLNSLKMKLSILVGIVQMNLGLLLSYLNAKFFRSDLDVRYQVIPQALFLNALFGYLCLLIIVKWCTGSKADLYHVMIYMFLSPTSDLGENELFWGQKGLQITLLLLAIAAVPWMLLVKPLILRHQYQRRFQGRHYGVLGRKDSNRLEMDSTSDMQHEEFDFSEIFVHQLIHTIEFVLGAVSSTASYLRLWALSLAHAELSSVFYEKLLLQAWSYDSLLIKALGTIIFMSATVGVLLIMETLSAFLHTLRLHWVEFQNKFFHGDGYKFEPFSFATIKEDDMHY